MHTHTLRVLSLCAGVTSSMPMEKPESPSVRADSLASRDITWQVEI